MIFILVNYYYKLKLTCIVDLIFWKMHSNKSENISMVS